jgi:hypothetical protein
VRVRRLYQYQSRCRLDSVFLINIVRVVVSIILISLIVYDCMRIDHDWQLLITNLCIIILSLTDVCIDMKNNFRRS